MFRRSESCSTVSIILPPEMMLRVAELLSRRDGATGLLWRARGTIVHEHWLKAWLPPISPSKSMLQLIIPDSEVAPFVREVVELTNLDHQALGAVFSVRSERAFFGPDFPQWPTRAEALNASPPPALKENLHALHCVVSHKLIDRVCKAAIDAGAHGPIVAFAEGRGLRDRLGWLRITKEHEKEVATVLCDDDARDAVFSAIADAGNLHLPGRGFLYDSVVERGLFNLPSRAAPRHHDASLQQIVAAIDKLQGHTHWRDHSIVPVGSQGQAVGLERATRATSELTQYRLAATVLSEQAPALIDLLLDSGAPGLTLSRARLVGADDDAFYGETHLARECTMIQVIATEAVVAALAAAVEDYGEQQGITHLCVALTPVTQVVTYQPGRINYRRAR
ncbi:MAG: hypothetical protein AAF648_11820 [Pseudomonadota bacterium]